MGLLKKPNDLLSAEIDLPRARTRLKSSTASVDVARGRSAALQRYFVEVTTENRTPRFHRSDEKAVCELPAIDEYTSLTRKLPDDALARGGA